MSFWTDLFSSRTNPVGYWDRLGNDANNAFSQAGKWVGDRGNELGHTLGLTHDPIDPSAQASLGQDNPFRQGQIELAKHLWSQANGQGPSLAQGQLQSATDQGLKQAMALGAAQQGQGLGYQSALMGIGNRQAEMQQEAAAQSAQLRMMEQLQAQQQLGQLYGGGRSEDTADTLGLINAKAGMDAQSAAAWRDVVKAGGQAVTAAATMKSEGGEIHGRANTSGDSRANDTVPAMLSPGEIVLPRSVAQSSNAPDAAAAFVEAIRKQSGGDVGQHLKRYVDIDNQLRAMRGEPVRAAFGYEAPPDVATPDQSATEDVPFAEKYLGVPSGWSKREGGLPGLISGIGRGVQAGVEGLGSAVESVPGAVSGWVGGAKPPEQLPGLGAGAPPPRPKSFAPDAPGKKEEAPVKPAAVAQSGGGTSKFNKEIDEATKLQTQGMDAQRTTALDQAKAEGDLLKEKANIAQEAVVHQQKMATDYQQDLSARMGDLDRATREWSSTTVDPGRLWANKNTGDKILAGIGIFLGGIGGGPNQALGIIQAAIDRDIDAQKANIDIKGKAVGMKQNAISQLRQKFGDDASAQAALTASMWTRVASQIDEQKARFAGPERQAALDDLKGKALANAAMEKEKFALQATTIASEKSLRDAQLRLMNAKAAGLGAVGAGGPDAMQELGQSFGKTGPLAVLAKHFSATDSGAYEHDKKVFAETLTAEARKGRYRDADVKRLMGMLPDADTPREAGYKQLRAVARMMAELKGQPGGGGGDEMGAEP